MLLVIAMDHCTYDEHHSESSSKSGRESMLLVSLEVASGIELELAHP